MNAFLWTMVWGDLFRIDANEKRREEYYFFCMKVAAFDLQGMEAKVTNDRVVGEFLS